MRLLGAHSTWLLGAQAARRRVPRCRHTLRCGTVSHAAATHAAAEHPASCFWQGWGTLQRGACCCCCCCWPIAMASTSSMNTLCSLARSSASLARSSAPRSPSHAARMESALWLAHTYRQWGDNSGV